jgi:hypothetical protein
MVSEGIDERQKRRRQRGRIRSSRIYYAAGEPPSFLAMWTSRLAVFCAVALVTTFALHRASLVPPPVTIMLAAAVFGGAALALAMALIAGLDIWVTGRKGAARVFLGCIVALGLLAIPASVWLVSLGYPKVYDISTDMSEPPAFIAAKAERGPGANPVAYPGKAFADLQRQTWPDLKSLIIPRPTDETYELVLQALTKLKLKPTRGVPPDDEAGTPGFIETTDRSLILGLTDDIAIRVVAEDDSSRVDVRSAARYGPLDFGRNAEHVRTILKEIAGRFEASVPDPTKAHAKKSGKSKVKGSKDDGRGSAASRKRRGPSR